MFKMKKGKMKIFAYIFAFALLATGISLLIYHLTKGDESPSKENKSPSFRGFKDLASEEHKPWCVGTSYAYSYEINGIEGPKSEYSEYVKSITQSNPIFQITLPTSGKVVIYRKISGESAEKKLDLTVSDTGLFTDTINPCGSEFIIPTPEPLKHAPGGIQDGELTWEMEAPDGSLPWCAKTTYAYTLSKHGITSKQSPSSTKAISYIYTNPMFIIPQTTMDLIAQGYTIDFFRQSDADQLGMVPYNGLVYLSDNIVVDRSTVCSIPNKPKTAPVFQDFKFTF